MDSVILAPWAGPYPCPCCGYVTLRERGAFEICPTCSWEDDGQDDHDADDVRGGPNGRLSLADARRNFQSYGASDERARLHVRPPEVADATGAAVPSSSPTEAMHPVLRAQAVRRLAAGGESGLGKVVQHWTSEDPWTPDKRTPSRVCVDWGRQGWKVHSLDELEPAPPPESWSAYWSSRN